MKKKCGSMKLSFKSSLFLGLFILISSSCESTKKHDYERLVTDLLLQENESLKPNSLFLLIPNTYCGPCVEFHVGKLLEILKDFDGIIYVVNNEIYANKLNAKHLIDHHHLLSRAKIPIGNCLFYKKNDDSEVVVRIDSLNQKVDYFSLLK